MRNKIILFLTLMAGLFSCVSNRKLVYLQNQSQALADTTVSQDFYRTKYKLQINDNISVKFHTIDEKTFALFNNATTTSMNMGGGMTAGDIYYMTGYTVGDSGMVELPLIGKVKVVGLTIDEAKVEIEKAGQKYFNNFFVDVKFGGIRYTVLGEVTRPGKFVILQKQLNIFEAIANSGDLTFVANRKDVQLIRQFPEGPQVYSLDLTDRKILYSPYYFIQPNDIIYVKPLKVKSIGAGTTGLSTFQGIVSLISAVLLVISITRL